jgi:hypothetical protein
VPWPGIKIVLCGRLLIYNSSLIIAMTADPARAVLWVHLYISLAYLVLSSFPILCPKLTHSNGNDNSFRLSHHPRDLGVISCSMFRAKRSAHNNTLRIYYVLPADIR